MADFVSLRLRPRAQNYESKKKRSAKIRILRGFCMAIITVTFGVTDKNSVLEVVNLVCSEHKLRLPKRKISK